MEACAGSHYWARELAALGHETRLIAPSYVKPFVKRQKNDMADAEAICEAAQRPTMRFVKPKTAEAQASATVFRTRDLLVRQRTQMTNALRGHLAEFGMVVRKGAEHAAKLIALVRDPASELPEEARTVFEVLPQMLQQIEEKITVLDIELPGAPKPTRSSQAIDDNPRRRADHRHRAGRARPGSRDLPARSRLRRLDWSDAAAEVERRQGAVGQGLEDGRAHAAAPADHRG
jgi:transposase